VDKEIGEGHYRFDYNSETTTFLAYMPSNIHNCLQLALMDILKDMVEVGFLTWPQFKTFGPSMGTRYEDFVGAYAGSVKEPDMAIVVDGRQINGAPTACPVWVNECAYSDSKPKLDRHPGMDNWN
jgi:hypothetical protein